MTLVIGLIFVARIVSYPVEAAIAKNSLSPVQFSFLDADDTACFSSDKLRQKRVQFNRLG